MAGRSGSRDAGWEWIFRGLSTVDSRLRPDTPYQLMFRLAVTGLAATAVLCVMVVGAAGAMDIVQKLVQPRW